MTLNTVRFGFGTLTLIAAAAMSTLAPIAPAQTTTTPADASTRIAVVKGHDVYVRCGAAESYYTFAKLRDGDLVKITGEKYEWSRVAPIGPAFGETFGFIKYAKGEAGRFRLAADGKTGVTLGKIDIIAPNLDSRNNPKDSWKSLVRLDADQTLRVVETIETEKDTIHKIVLPEAAQGWVSTAHLEQATADQSKQWGELLAAHIRSLDDREKAKTTAANATPATKRVANATAAATPTTPAVTPTTPAPTTPAATTGSALSDAQITDALQVASSDTLIENPEVSLSAETLEATTVKVEAKPEPKLPTLDDLEAALKRLQKEAIETAEVNPLRELYLDLAQREHKDARVVRYANGRAEQLQVWADIQRKRADVDALRHRSKLSAEETIAAQRLLEQSAEYVAVGRVAASTIYDGESLPKLLRLQDASTGRTVAYLQLDEQYEAANLIGNFVGIVGDKSYDGSMRLNIVHPKRVDLLTPESRTAIAPTN